MVPVSALRVVAVVVEPNAEVLVPKLKTGAGGVAVVSFLSLASFPVEKLNEIEGTGTVVTSFLTSL